MEYIKSKNEYNIIYVKINYYKKYIAKQCLRFIYYRFIGEQKKNLRFNKGKHYCDIPIVFFLFLSFIFFVSLFCLFVKILFVTKNHFKFLCTDFKGQRAREFSLFRLTNIW